MGNTNINIRKKIFTLMQFLLIIAITLPINIHAKKIVIPSHPSKLNFPELNWKVPLGKDFRLSNGKAPVMYIAKDNTLPLVSISGYIKAGTLNDPIEKKGLTYLLTRMMRSGGTEKFNSDSLDELLDRLAIKFSINASTDMINFNITALSDYTDTVLLVLNQILFHPAFEKNRLEREKNIVTESIKHQFDNPSPILRTTYTTLIYPNSLLSKIPTVKSISSITKKDLINLHKKIFWNGNIILAVSGDIDKKSIIKKINDIFRNHNSGTMTRFPKVNPDPLTKCVVVHKKISQAYVRIGIPTFSRPNKDYYPLSILNVILGGSGFSSRLTTRIRSNEGLTYSIYSHAESRYTYPGTIYINFFTKNSTVNKSIGLCLEEVNKVLKNGITDEELTNAKKILIDGLPSAFRNSNDVTQTYAWNEYYGRDENQYAVYPKKINAITKEDVEKVAIKYLKPNDFSYVVVTDTADLFSSQNSDSLFSIKTLSPVIITPNDIKNLPNIIAKGKQ